MQLTPIFQFHGNFCSVTHSKVVSRNAVQAYSRKNVLHQYCVLQSSFQQYFPFHIYTYIKYNIIYKTMQ